MRSARCLTLIATVLVVATLFIVGCKSSPDSTAQGLAVDESVIADVLGDCNRVGSAVELGQLQSYFSQHDTGWFVGVFPLSLEESDKAEVSNDVVFIQFGRFRLWGPYENETELRNAWKGQAVDTPYLGIYVIEKAVSYTITHLYRASGSAVYDGEWKEIVIAGNAASHKVLSASLNAVDVPLGEEFLLGKNQCAVVEGEDLVVEVVEFYNPPCPEGCVCFWSGIGILFQLWHAGETQAVLVQGGHDFTQVFGYQTTIIETDHETFARLTITKM